MVSLLHRSGRRHLLRHRWQSALAILGITLGVAVVLAVELANQSARRAFALSLEQIEGRVSHRLVGVGGTLDENFYRQLRRADGLREIAPVIEGEVVLHGERFKLLGLDPLAERPLRSLLPKLDSLQLRTLMTTPDTVLLPYASAARLAIGTNDRIELEIAGERRSVTVAGIAGDSGTAVPDGLLLADIASAQTLLRMPGVISRIELRLNDDDVRKLAARLPAGMRLERAGRRDSTSRALSDAFQTNLSAMSLLALLVGAFLIYNAMTVSVLQRRAQFGTLRLLGVTRGELFRLLLGETLLIGAFGSVLGLLLGWLLAQGLVTLVARTINDLFFSLRVSSLMVQPLDLFRGGLLGILTTLAATLLPALEAARSEPIVVSRRSELETRAHRAVPWLALAGIVSLLAGGAMLVLFRDGLLAGFVALFLLIIGYSLCVPGGVLLITRALQPLTERFGGIGTRLAVRGISASLSRTGLAVAALTLAVATTLAMGTMISSFRTTVSDWLEQTLQGDLYLSLPERANAAAAAQLISDLHRLQGVRELSMGRSRPLELATGQVRLLALQTASRSHRGFTFKGHTLASLWPRFHAGELLLVSEPYAYREHLQAGDSMTLPTPAGPVEFLVGGVFHDYGTNPGLLVMAMSSYRHHWRDQRISTLGIFLHSGQPWEPTISAIRRLTASFGEGASLAANGEIRARSLALFDRTFTVTRVLRLLVVLIAFVGILSAFMAMQLERSREYATLRATGLTPGELLRLVVVQSALLGLLAGVLALPLGWLMGETLIEVINLRSFGWTLQSLLPLPLLGEALLLALSASLLAALYPALRLSRLPPAAAMREE
ncbi:MAG: ABC transporter permease [Gammaproteobacteria bacterium]|nr:ABC transporter permease [Gammaproteobacteria bacterium]